ncbi:MAG TPA: hypothetical protein VHV28_06950 [Solirubrobacteraceae bacterium]|nr:hypothetical protein [Solirubrobacteraceae bacterium]
MTEDSPARRISARRGVPKLAAHLTEAHGTEVTEIAQLDLGVYRVDRIERPAAQDPVSELEAQPVLVTEYVPSVPPERRRAAIVAAGGLRALGWLPGGLHPSGLRHGHRCPGPRRPQLTGAFS